MTVAILTVVGLAVVGPGAAARTEAALLSAANPPVSSPVVGPEPGTCAVFFPPVDPPEYYDFPIVSTRRVPGTGQATGVGQVSFVPSPFGLALAADGSYMYDLTLSSARLATARDSEYVVWVTTPTLDQVRLMGTLDEQGGIQGRVEWNKFLVVVTLEARPDAEATMWSGPIVMRGMSRSGMMHTMAGHGPFETENCAVYGY